VLKKKQANPLEEEPEALEAHLELLEKRFERLKTLYESFFAGIEKQMPLVPRREMNRLIVQTQQLNIGKATLRFRFQTLLQRWVTYTAQWNRIQREIEQGTYQRDLAKVQRHLAEVGGTLTDAQALAMGVPAARVKVFVERQNRKVAEREARGADAVPSAAKSVPRPASIPGVTQSQLNAFYDQYNQARAQVGDLRPSKSLEDLAMRLKPQIEKVLAESRAARAKLSVSIENGKVKVVAEAE
jgi:hypothetical protein